MHIKNRWASLIYKIALAGLSGLGLYLTSGLRAGAYNPFMLNFFTILSNYMVFFYALVSAACCARDIKKLGAQGSTTVLPHFKGAFMMAIFVTFLIYQFLLIPYHFSMDGGHSFRWSNTLIHHIVPLMMVADWALFDKKGSFRIRDPFIWCSVPLAYFLFCLIRAEVGPVLQLVDSRYPYFFIDVDALGGLQVFWNVLLFAAFYIGVGFAFYWIDRKLGSRK